MNQFKSCSLSVLVALTLALFASGQEHASSPAKVPAHATQQTIFILTEERPLLLQIHVLLNGRPLVEHWCERAEALFRFLDTDKDGLLSREETSRLHLLASFRIGLGLPSDYNNDGKISLEEFRRWLLDSNYGPLLVGQYPLMSSPGFGTWERLPFASPLRVGLSLQMFGVLDQNRDGKLDAREIERSGELLRSCDEDEDELVTPGEILNSAAQPVSIPNARGWFAGPRNQPVAPTPGRLQILASEQRVDDAVRTLQMLYSQENVAISRRRLRNEDLHLPSEVFQRFDTNGDGWLDAEEIRGFLKRPADAEVVLHLEESANLNQQPRARFVEASARFGWRVSRTDDEVTLGSDKARVRVTARAWLTAMGRHRFASRDAAKANFLEINLKNALLVFMQADVDQNGYLNEREFRRVAVTVPAMQIATFARFDRNGDGKLTREEYEAFLREVLEAAFVARGMGLSLSLDQQGPALFEMLDTNRDGKLSMRELRRAAAVLRSLDRNGDGVVEWTELTAHYQLDIGVTEPSNELSRMFVAQPVQVPPKPAVEIRPSPDAPAWFRAMDRNGDGDISRREFPGTDAEFRQLDANGDGLISLDEAVAASKASLPSSGPQPAKKP